MNEFLSSFDCTRERKISLVEFKTHGDADVKAGAEDIFRVLDSNKDGLLDFDDFLVLFYIKKGVIGDYVCSYCGELLSGRPFFSCVPCLPQFPNTFDLCCHCYSRGDFHHHHPSTDFLHDEALVLKFMRQPKTQLKGEKEMEELQNIAMLHYNATTPDAKVKVKQFFYSMDRDADGKINERDFLSFMREQKLDHLRDGGFFEKIDMDGDGALCFEEVITLYYLIRSGRPHCDWCRKFIPGVFFSCIRCFKSQSSFILCRTCYQSNDCDHASDHGGATTFIDNYTLLDTLKQFPLHSNQQAEASSPGAIVPVRSGATKSDIAFQALKLATSISETVGKIADAVGARCAIM